MVIRLSPTLKKRVARAAKAKGVTPTKLAETALKEYLAPKSKPREEVSEARRQLRELAKYKKPIADFDAAVHSAKAYARKSYEDNAEFIELASKRFSKSENSPAP